MSPDHITPDLYINVWQQMPCHVINISSHQKLPAGRSDRIHTRLRNDINKLSSAPCVIITSVIGSILLPSNGPCRLAIAVTSLQ